MKDLVKQFPSVSLTAEQEAKMSPEELVMAHMHRAILYLQRVDRGRLSVQTLTSLSYEALNASVKNYDPSRQRFFAFCKARLRGILRRHWTSLRVVKKQTSQVSLDQWMHPSISDVVAVKGKNILRDYLFTKDGGNSSGSGTFVSTRESLTGEVVAGLEEVMARDRWLTIRNRLEKYLPDHYWIVLDLVYYHNLCFRAVGELLGVSSQLAQKRHQDALKRLRRVIREKDPLKKL